MDIEEIFGNTPPPAPKKRPPKQIALAVFAALVLVVGIFVGGYFAGYAKNGVTNAEKDMLADMPDLVKAYEAIKNNYIDYADLSWEDFQYTVIAGMLGNLDDFSGLVVSENAQQQQASLGTTIRRTEYGQYLLSGVAPGSVAYENGVRKGDMIYKIRDDKGEDKAVSGLDYTAFSKLLARDVLTITFIRPSIDARYSADYSEANAYELTLAKAVRPAKTAYFKKIDDTVGYIEFTGFEGSAVADVIEAARQFVESGCKKLVLDLRGNGGGSVDILAQIAPLFIKSGDTSDNLFLMRVARRDGTGYTYKSVRKDADGNALDNGYLGDRVEGYSLAVLSDGYTASASEALIAAIQYYGTGTLVGQKTYGKGVAQTVLKLNDYYDMYVTTALYYVKATVNGQDTEINIRDVGGFTPSAENFVPEMPLASDFAKDAAIVKALEIFSRA